MREIGTRVQVRVHKVADEVERLQVLLRDGRRRQTQGQRRVRRRGGRGGTEAPAQVVDVANADNMTE